MGLWLLLRLLLLLLLLRRLHRLGLGQWLLRLRHSRGICRNWLLLHGCGVGSLHVFVSVSVGLRVSNMTLNLGTWGVALSRRWRRR